MDASTVSNVWQKSKLLVKGLLIGVLVLLLLIPAYFVEGLIRERQDRQLEAVAEVSSKWAAAQNITGPVLVVPYEEVIANDKGGFITTRQTAYFLPDALSVDATVHPEKKHRGIYEVMLYSSEIKLSGKFSPLPLATMKLDTSKILWNESYVCMGISDPKGLRSEMQLQWNDSLLSLNQGGVTNSVFKDAFSTPALLTADKAATTLSFSATVSLNGSNQLLFTPIGKETNVVMRSAWPDPSFTGSQLPVKTMVSDSGFVAQWKSLSHTRNFPQQWKNDGYNLSSNAFGADLFVPVSTYQKTLRSVKYAILCILLTFTGFFLIETIHKKSVHPLHYALIGFALILFYTLLLSFSEYIGFNMAYGVASLATVGLITWFVKGLLNSARLSMLLSVVLVLLYSYVFTVMQVQDAALLLGSLGLFLALAIVMYFSKKIQW